eukprot:COSAG05_NODE_1319_length_5194_cov_20.004534_3_plen_67_part_00
MVYGGGLPLTHQDPSSSACIAPGRLASETDISCMSPILIFSGKDQPWLTDSTVEELVRTVALLATF